MPLLVNHAANPPANFMRNDCAIVLEAGPGICHADAEFLAAHGVVRHQLPEGTHAFVKPIHAGPVRHRRTCSLLCGDAVGILSISTAA